MSLELPCIPLQIQSQTAGPRETTRAGFVLCKGRMVKLKMAAV